MVDRIDDFGLEILRGAAEENTFENKYDLRIKNGNPSGLPVSLGDSTSIDAFGRLRVSNPVTLFDSQSQYNRKLLQFFEKTVGSGSLSHNADESSVDLDVTTAANDEVIRQSKRYIRYQPGKSQFVFITFAFGTTQTNTSKWIGYGDDENGIFLKNEGGSLKIVKRSKVSGSVVDTEVAQASWNKDVLDGTGKSGITLDAEKTQIFFIDLEWLGVGRVRTGFVIDGKIYEAHEFNHANSTDTTYMTTANLPIRYHIKVAALNSSADSLKSICASVISEGGFEADRGFPFATPNLTEKAVTTEVPILAIQPKPTFNSIVNRMELIKPHIYLSARTNDAFFKIYYDTTLTGASFTDVDSTYSAVQYDVTASAFSGGILIGVILVGSESQNKVAGSGIIDLLSGLPFCLDIDGANPINIVITAQARTATSNVWASFSWQELT